MNSAGTLVCFAVKEEARYFQRRTDSDIRILITGMGEANARISVESALARQRPARVITAGFAGGLDPGLERGTIVFFAEEGAGLEGALRDAGARPVQFACSRRVVSTASEKERLFAGTGAQAVEMESGPIHELCRAAAIPAATIRVILDTAEENLAFDFNELMTPDMRLDGSKLAWALVKAPWKIPGLLRLQRQSSSAAKRLGELLEKVLFGTVTVG
jgi:adenosylhomocysteine nucleosidase